MSLSLLICLLIGFNIVQLFFWSWQVQLLINKLMSKNFAEYEWIKKGPQTKEDPKEDLDAVLEEKEILQQLNGMLQV